MDATKPFSALQRFTSAPPPSGAFGGGFPGGDGRGRGRGTAGAAPTNKPLAAKKPRSCGICHTVGHTRVTCPQRWRGDDDSLQDSQMWKSDSIFLSIGSMVGLLGECVTFFFFFFCGCTLLTQSPELYWLDAVWKKIYIYKEEKVSPKVQDLSDCHWKTKTCFSEFPQMSGCSREDVCHNC